MFNDPRFQTTAAASPSTETACLSILSYPVIVRGSVAGVLQISGREDFSFETQQIAAEFCEKVCVELVTSF